jgi:hypothetical protein
MSPLGRTTQPWFQPIARAPEPARQLPPTHRSAASQDVPQEPQFRSEEDRSISQPFVGSPSQSANPGVQAPSRQAPPAQLAEAFAPTQGAPQAPQLAALVCVSTQAPPQSVSGGEQIATQPLAWQAGSVAGQIAPQPAQSVAVPSGVSQPVEASASQSPHDGLHEATPHRPVAQVAVPLATPQPVAQPPQSAVVVSKVSQPLAGSASQLAQPGSHPPRVQVPPEHADVARGKRHASPQAAQSAGVPRGTSQPLAASASQSAQPASQPMGRQVPLTQVAVP